MAWAIRPALPPNHIMITVNITLKNINYTGALAIAKVDRVRRSFAFYVWRRGEERMFEFGNLTNSCEDKLNFEFVSN